MELSYRGPIGAIKTRRKQRASLIQMDEGVELVASEEGWPIVRTRNNSGRADSNDERGRVSSDDDSRAQLIKMR
jgi:hypothetical protein